MFNFVDTDLSIYRFFTVCLNAYHSQAPDLKWLKTQQNTCKVKHHNYTFFYDYKETKENSTYIAKCVFKNCALFSS